ncbi:MAG: hypothetical protein H6624_18935 [Bdellovibrionaceae bacterium]|nr:hypothetical protein [Bdellovibrionales bacterium]MCB9086423.1 hypothetical protein [Pseudobdellovibrionaceae bacterium]
MLGRRPFHNFVLLIGSVVLTLALAELSIRGYFTISGGAPEGAKSLFNKISMIDLKGESECSGTGSEVIPHPYFAFTKNPYHPCNRRGSTTNRHGFLNPSEFPEFNEDTHFDIVLLGGSVASIMALGWDHKDRAANYIEKILNDRFQPPHGQSFRVYNGGMDGGSQPLQNAVLMNLGERFDGVIIIDGYNESLHSNHFLMGTPAIGLYLDGFKTLNNQVNAGLMVKLAKILRSNSAFSWSYLAGSLHGSLLNLSVHYEMNQLAEDLEKIYYGAAQPPATWSKEDLHSYNAEKYAQLTLMAQSMSNVMGLKFAHFLQPIRWLYKPLTERERSFQKYCEVEFYQKMEDALRMARETKGLQTFSLLKLLEGNANEFYGDHIHFKFSDDGQNEGNRLMAEAIVKELEKVWALQPNQ